MTQFLVPRKEILELAVHQRVSNEPSIVHFPVQIASVLTIF